MDGPDEGSGPDGAKEKEDDRINRLGDSNTTLPLLQTQQTSLADHTVSFLWSSESFSA